MLSAYFLITLTCKKSSFVRQKPLPSGSPSKCWPSRSRGVTALENVCITTVFQILWMTVWMSILSVSQNSCHSIPGTWIISGPLAHCHTRCQVLSSKLFLLYPEALPHLTSLSLWCQGKEIFHLGVHSPKCPNSQIWARQQPGARKLQPGFPHGWQGPTYPWATSQGHWQVAEQEAASLS